MPSNKEYIKQAGELAAELGVEITTDGLNNEKLANLVSDLKAKVRDKALDTQVDDQTPGDGPVALLGSDQFENSYEIDGDDVPLGDLVGAAYEKSGLTVEQWNELSDEDRDARIGDELAGRINQAEHAKVEAAAKEEQLPPYYVKKGKAITTRRGIRSDGQEITASDLIGGVEALEGFVKSGHVGKA